MILLISCKTDDKTKFKKYTSCYFIDLPVSFGILEDDIDSDPHEDFCAFEYDTKDSITIQAYGIYWGRSSTEQNIEDFLKRVIAKKEFKVITLEYKEDWFILKGYRYSEKKYFIWKQSRGSNFLCNLHLLSDKEEDLKKVVYLERILKSFEAQ